MNKSQKILFNDSVKGNDMHFKVKLEQNVDNLQFLSMDVSTEDVYQNFNSDYGVLVGRVIANGGIGIPNAKISIFIPLSDEDSTNSEISSIYPYKTPRDKNNEGKRYNLLPRVAKIDPITNQWKPKQPFGSFPIKEEIVTNVEYLDVYKKYYKYTALTNYAGDYMIFGVPVGTQTVHLSVDITDIGKYSMTPAAMVTNLGYSPNLFTQNRTRIKESRDLNDLPNIETQEISVEVIPFWGDTENFEIGITRQDFRIRSVLKNTFVIFGSAFTDSNETVWGRDVVGGRKINELNRVKEEAAANLSISTKRIGRVTEKIYYYPPEISDNDIESGNVDPRTDMIILDETEYSAYQRGGDFAFIINCNRDKVITDESGKEIPISYDSPDGVFTKFRGFITLEMTLDDVPATDTSSIGDNTTIKSIRFKLKFPQAAQPNHTFTLDNEQTNPNDNNNWRKQSYVFENSKLYSLSRFHGTTFCRENTSNPYEDSEMSYDSSRGFWNHDEINIGIKDSYWNAGMIITSNLTDVSEVTTTAAPEDGTNDFLDNEDFQFPTNTTEAHGFNSFGAQWVNLGIYFPQTTFVEAGYSYIKKVRGLSNFTRQKKDNRTFNNYSFFDNQQEIAGGDFNTMGFARSDLQWTDIIEVPLSDVQEMYLYNKKGFTSSELSTLSGTTYRNGVNVPTNPTVNWSAPCPFNGGKLGAVPSNPADPDTYFFKGLGIADCIDYLYVLGIVS